MEQFKQAIAVVFQHFEQKKFKKLVIKLYIQMNNNELFSECMQKVFR